MIEETRPKEHCVPLKLGTHAIFFNDGVIVLTHQFCVCCTFRSHSISDI